MKRISVLKLNKMIWALAGVVTVLSLVIVSLLVAQSATKPTPKAPSPPTIAVAPVEQKDVPVYEEGIGTLRGQVNADVKALVTGYLLKQHYKGRTVRQIQRD